MKLTQWAQALLIGCGASKQPKPARAAELYTSTYFRAKVEFAEALGLPWAILSGHLGIVQPDTLTQPYDLNAESLTPHEQREWCAGVALQLFEWQRPIERLAIIAGENYYQPLANTLPAFDVETFNPCAHLGIGEQMQWMKGDRSPELLDIHGQLFIRRNGRWFDQRGEIITNPGRSAHMDAMASAA